MANLSNINNKFLVTTGGDVGVGVTSPGSKLSIGGTTGSYDSGIGFQPTGTGARIYRTFIATDGSFRFDDVTAGFLTRLTIQAGGNVGIGTTSPAAGLQVAKGGLSIPPAGGAQSSAVFGNVTSDDNYGLAVGANSNGIGYISSQRTDGTATTYNLAIQPNGGNVGIGTDLPNNKLDVNGDVFINSNYTANVAAQDLTIGKTTTGNHGLTIVTGPTYTGSIYFGDSGNNDAGIIKYQHSNNSMQFVTNRSEAMRINSSGNVGIGTTNIGTQSNLYLGASSSSEGGQITLQKATGGTLAAHIDAYTSGGTDFMRVLSGTDTATTAAPFVFNLTSVRLGIGTTSPSSDISGSVTMLEINDATNNNLASLALKAGTQGSKWEIAAQSSNALGFFDDGTERMRIDSNGNLGIGTTSPQRLLHLRSTNEATGIFLERSANYGFVQYNQVVGSVETYHLGFVNNNTFSSDILVANESGNVGIGTASPQAKLSVVGSGENGGIFFNNSGAQEHRFYSSANSQFNTIGSSTPIWNWAQYTGVGVTPNYKMTLNNTGLGIGTTAPSEKLHVSGGNVRIDSVSNANHLIIQNNATATSGVFEERIKFLGWNDNENAAITGIGNAYFGSPVNALAFSVSAVEAMRIKHGGNVGIGTTSPNSKLNVYDATADTSINVNTGTGGSYPKKTGISFGATSTSLGGDAKFTGGAGIQALNTAASGNPTDLTFWTNSTGTPAERMRITSVGELKIGATSGTDPSRIQVGGNSTTARIIPHSDNVGYIGDSSHRWQAIYAVNGTIQTSDIREKTEIRPTQLGLDFVNDLNPVSYKWIENERIDGNKDERNHQGLIAQEVAKTLEKHGVNKNEFGGLDIQKTDKYDDFHGMSYEQLVAPMIKAIQELKAEVEELKK